MPLILTPQACNISVPGIARGQRVSTSSNRPVGAELVLPSVRCVALAGLEFVVLHDFPGRCPGLACRRPTAERLHCNAILKSTLGSQGSVILVVATFWGSSLAHASGYEVRLRRLRPVVGFSACSLRLLLATFQVWLAAVWMVIRASSNGRSTCDAEAHMHDWQCEKFARNSARMEKCCSCLNIWSVIYRHISTPTTPPAD